MNNGYIKSDVFLMDNIIFMRNCKDKEFDYGIVDPEYLNYENNKTNENQIKGGRLVKGGTSFLDFSGKPTEEYFYHLFRITKDQFIFGGNYFTDLMYEDSNGNSKHFLYTNNNWFVWVKQIADAKWSMFEQAWTSINNNARCFQCSPMGKVAKWHPTSKPVDVYRYIYKSYLKPGSSILDTNLGSGSSRIAAISMGFNFTGIEINEKFFNLSNRDFNIFYEKNRLFLPKIECDNWF